MSGSRADLPGADPERAYIARLAVQSALGELAPRRRAIVVLHEMDGADVSDIAGFLGLSPITVRWHLSRARKQLAKLLAPPESTGRIARKSQD